MILFYNSEVKFDGFSLQGFMRTFPLLCIYERSEKKITCGILFALGRDKKERPAKSITYTLQWILHTETFGTVLYGNFCTEKYFC